MSNLETVQQIYAAFGRGDIPAILEYLDEDVEWEYAIAPIDVPWIQHRRGKDEIPKFFESLDGMEFHEFTPNHFLENDNLVVVLIDVDLTVKATDRRIVEKDEVHIWHFNPQGRVIRFGHKMDTFQHWSACRGEGLQKS